MPAQACNHTIGLWAGVGRGCEEAGEGLERGWGGVMTLSSEFYGLEEWPGRQRRKQLAAEQQLARERTPNASSPELTQREAARTTVDRKAARLHGALSAAGTPAGCDLQGLRSRRPSLREHEHYPRYPPPWQWGGCVSVWQCVVVMVLGWRGAGEGP